MSYHRASALLDPLPFVQQLVRFGASTLNALMTATHVEQLPGVQPTELMTGPATDRHFEPDNVRRISLLNGLAAW
jgi:hypothetical protein